VAEGVRYDVGVVGAGYVGVPLAATFAEAGCSVLVVDVLEDVVAALNRGESHIADVPSARLAPLVEQGLIRATTSYEELPEAEAVLIALPTPLSQQREPDLSIVTAAVRDIAERLQKGQLVVLESTTYPGTTREVVQPLLEDISGLKAGDQVEFFVEVFDRNPLPGREPGRSETRVKTVATPAQFVDWVLQTLQQESRLRTLESSQREIFDDPKTGRKPSG
jgi:UDP-N-acetyl-D-glucosamine dehydrogenase